MPAHPGLADVEQRRKQARIKAFLREGRPFGQHADRVMAVQAFLMACDNAEIADAGAAGGKRCERGGLSLTFPDLADRVSDDIYSKRPGTAAIEAIGGLSGPLVVVVAA